ncbi:hypothetical protein [Pseudomonas argentinensis]|uniref:hypothetical protein n=1 Tax=Phytopseudomonas argentinensis TaxID=289370 RepID=UPI0008A82D82|nr:hypothetical protein [Pseudomonas argentinensis]
MTQTTCSAAYPFIYLGLAEPYRSSGSSLVRAELQEPLQDLAVRLPNLQRRGKAHRTFIRGSQSLPVAWS